MLLLFLLTCFAAVAGTLQVEVLDVGQGDSLLLRSPAGKTVLIDGGTGKRNVVRMLEVRDITKLDLIIATHNHADHIGGLDEVLEALPVSNFVDGGIPHTTETYLKIVQLIEQKNIGYKAVRGGQVFRLDDGITINILGPDEPLLSGTRSDLNSNSVIARVDHGENCFLLMGDAELETEHRVMAKGLAECDVLKVAHHGSAYATSKEFLEAVKPTWAAISVGRNNRYKHPAPTTLGRIEKSGATVLRTDLHGRVLFESDGKKLEVFVAHEPAEGGGLPVGVQRKMPPRPEPTGEGPAALAMAASHGAPPSAPDIEEEVEPAKPAAPAAPAIAPVQQAGELLNINTATVEQLQTIPGIGPSRAAAIVQYRTENGAFASLDAVDAVPGIGPALIRQLMQHAEVR